MQALQRPQDPEFMRLAYGEARRAFEEGGIPVGAVMVTGDQLVGRGHNKRIQDGDPIAHGEMDCVRNAGHLPSYENVHLYTTLSPCMMCIGMILQFGIGRVVVGDTVNVKGDLGFLRARGVKVVVLDDPECVALMRRYIRENPGYGEYLAQSDPGVRPAGNAR